MVTPSPQKNFARLFTFSLIIIPIFFILFEVTLRVAEYQPYIQLQNTQLPYWVAKMDPTFIADYKNRLRILGKVNQDLYAYRPDLQLGYLLKPNYKRVVNGYSPEISVDNLPPWTLVADQDGYRTGSYETQIKKEGILEKSIFVLGDSSSFGWGIDFEDTYGFVFTDIINRSLKPGDGSYQTINRSMPGFTTFDGLKVVSQMSDIKAGDKVLVSFGSNDHASASITDHQRAANFQSTSEKLHRELEQFLLFKMLKSFWMSARISFVDETEHSVNRVSIDDYSKNLKIIFETIKNYEGEPVFVSICNFKHYTSAAFELTDATDIPFIDFVREVRPFLDQVPRRFPEKFMRYFDVYGEKMDEDELYAVLFPDGCHPNAIGHHLLGEVLFEVLERKSGKASKSGRKTG